MSHTPAPKMLGDEGRLAAAGSRKRRASTHRGVLFATRVVYINKIEVSNYKMPPSLLLLVRRVPSTRPSPEASWLTSELANTIRIRQTVLRPSRIIRRIMRRLCKMLHHCCHGVAAAPRTASLVVVGEAVAQPHLLLLAIAGVPWCQHAGRLTPYARWLPGE